MTRRPSRLATAIFNWAVGSDTASKFWILEYARLRLASLVASTFHLGFFSSLNLESKLEALSQKMITNFVEEDWKPLPNRGSTVHLITRAFSSGGHTRAVERWLGSSEQSSSIVLTRSQKLPEDLAQAIGDREFLVVKGGPLRRIRQVADYVSNFELAISHTHPFDVDAVLALWIARRRGTRVAIFNHADHQFWVGSTVAEVVLEFRKFGSELSMGHRGVLKTLIVGLPPNVAASKGLHGPVSSSKATKSKMLLCVGRNQKFAKIPGKPSLEEYLEKFLSENPEFKCTIVGPGRFSRVRKLKRKLGHRVTLLPRQPLSKLFELFSQASVGIDTFPMGGGTIARDMTSQGVPVVSLRCPTGSLDDLPQELWRLAESYAEWSEAILQFSASTEPFHDMPCPVLDQNHWGSETQALILRNAQYENASSLDEKSVSELNNFLWFTEPRLSNILTGRFA